MCQVHNKNCPICQASKGCNIASDVIYPMYIIELPLSRWFSLFESLIGFRYFYCIAIAFFEFMFHLIM